VTRHRKFILKELNRNGTNYYRHSKSIFINKRYGDIDFTTTYGNH